MATMTLIRHLFFYKYDTKNHKNLSPLKFYLMNVKYFEKHPHSLQIYLSKLYAYSVLPPQTKQLLTSNFNKNKYLPSWKIDSPMSFPLSGGDVMSTLTQRPGTLN